MDSIIEGKFRVLEDNTTKKSHKPRWRPRLEIDIDPISTRFAWTPLGIDLALAVVILALGIAFISHFVPFLLAVCIIGSLCCVTGLILMAIYAVRMYRHRQYLSQLDRWNEKYSSQKKGGTNS